MKEEIKVVTAKFSELLKEATKYIANTSEGDLKNKVSEGSWSKLEILGHLIDSGTHNLQRFLEVQFADETYKVRQYNQDELVKANGYNNADPMELLSFWLSINERILQVIGRINEKVFDYQIQLPNNDISDFKFLYTDYVVHLEHHINQIKK